MPTLRVEPSLLLAALVLLVFWARPAHAFGAGNIASMAKIEGQNWRHGDIEDTLLTLLMSRATNKKFSKMDVKRVYFGNWLRDYSQAVDVGTLKMVSGEAIRILLWILGFMSFGYGTKEFEVTTERLGCYRPEEHIDNPKDYADNIDARQYDRRLRGPVDERRELSIDERTGLKNYIASEDIGITTSAGMVRDLFRRCVDLGRRYNRSKNKAEFYEALRLLGTGLHCLEDYSAHSNYTELALIELGERDIFPHVGRRTQVQIRGARNQVYPIVTGTFGGVDFLHSVMGELSDKATQSEIQELEGTIAQSQNQQANNSLLKDLLDKLPGGIFGGSDEKGKADELQANAQAAQMQNMNISPRQPEAWANQMQEMQRQIYPIIEYHDEVMQGISETIDKIPVLPELVEQIQEQVNVFVFSLLAPFVLPVIRQVKNELATGSSEIIQSSREKQLIVFRDDNCTDPTHSMLSKDHFSNVLNEPAGKIASQVLKWAVPQLVECWDDEGIDADRTIHRIINGVFHHPAMRDYGDDGARDGRQLMFGVVQKWWGEMSRREQDDLRDKLSRSGVENGRNHKEGVHDKGHGCGKPLGMPNVGTANSSGAIGGVLGALAGAGGSSSSGGKGGDKYTKQVGNLASEAVGGGALGGLVGGLVSGVGADLLGGAFGEQEKKKSKKEKYNDDGSYTETYQEKGHKKSGSRGREEERFGQAQYSQTTYPGGGRREEFSRFEQDGRGGEPYGVQQRVETTGHGRAGYEQTEQTRYDRPGGQWESRESREGYDSRGDYYQTETKSSGKKSKKQDSEDEDSEDNGEDDWKKREKKERKKREKEEKKRREQGYGGGRDNDSDEEKKYKKKSSGEHKRRSGEGGHQQSYGQERSYGQEQSYGRQEQSYGRQEQSSYGGGREQESSYGGGGGYGRQEQSYGGGDSGGYSRPAEGYGGDSGGYDGRQQGYGGDSGGRQQGYGGDSGGRQESYGGDSGYERREEGGYGGDSGGYGGDSGGYGERRGGYGSRGYGGSD
ncbi:Het-C-domain-containing protein [Pseudovirgaria hyperparasitica]|uniref:Het-C-domain-containing protein n=1 Tax=Pseudovirgaria hyperparasitica TaxID=470096 RepID=A0A6A6W7H2_9PEZI|nr:Het-C-domain-containing protein [Pseudovirgaria hyperparasitica]KAF2758812.1 Het-C-domain-containing protein [Pseudovirgaria hyperparasitica]